MSTVSEGKADTSSAPEAPLEKKAGQQTSFIERYAHLFEESDQADNEKLSGAQTTRESGAIEKSRGMNAVQRDGGSIASASDGDEESIEQYMNKLLQRVRGQSARPGAAQSPSSSEELKATLTAQSLAVLHPAGGSLSEAVDPSAARPWNEFEGGWKKATTPAPKTDLEALRALANESARRAISRHSLRKHRRNAVTKAIVSSLAGVTSLWLILESADWRSLQTITACIALIVAAYWAGQTYRAMLEAFRETPDHDPQEDADDALVGYQAPLPIDMERPGALD
jgi:hypothetical protein